MPNRDNRIPPDRRPRSIQAFAQRDRNPIAGTPANRFEKTGLERQFVIAIAKRHERALERNTINGCANLHQPSRPEKLSRMRPDDIGSAAFGRAFAYLRIKGCVEKLSHLLPPDGFHQGRTMNRNSDKGWQISGVRRARQAPAMQPVQHRRRRRPNP